MSYQVLARKWRPQTFEEVTGQESVTKTLQNAIRSGRIAHAFLFSGVRGVGKTTTARILAKALNCRQGPTPTPCGECDSCLEIAASNSVDVLEIDAASNRGIDDVRELRESVRYGAARDRFKVFIIDEVHMLTKEAFNALLKTLEEPPAHVKMILATTEHHKIPVTITSRCQQYDFKPIPFALIFDRLKLISRQEEIEISDYALRAVASFGQGSMRDAQSAFDRILAFAGKQVRDDDVRTLLGVVDDRLVFGLFDSVVTSDREGLLRQTQELAEKGIEPALFCRRLVEHVRNLMVCKVAGWEEKLLNLPDTQKESLESQAASVSEVDLIRFYDLLSRTEGELRWHPHPAIHLEMTLVKLVELARLPLLEEFLSGLEPGAGRPTKPVAASAPARPAPVRPAPARPPATAVAVSTPSETADLRSQAPGPAAKEGPPADETSQQGPLDEFQHLLIAVQRQNPGLHTSLLQVESRSVTNGVLELRYSANQAFHAKLVGNNQAVLEELWAKIAGSGGRIVVRSDTTPPGPRKDPADDPAVRSFLDKFPSKIIVQRKAED